MRGSIPGCRSVRAANAVVRFLRGEPFAAVGAAIYAVIVIMALFAPQLAPARPARDATSGPPHRALSADLAASIGLAPPPADTTC